MRKNLIFFVFINFILALSVVFNAMADDVKTTGFYPLKEGDYKKIESTGNAILAAEGGGVELGGSLSMDMGAYGTVESALQVVGNGASVSGALLMDGPIQIQRCYGVGCSDIADIGRIWLDVSAAESEVVQS
jgi:hypothetical protein